MIKVFLKNGGTKLWKDTKANRALANWYHWGYEKVKTDTHEV